MQENAVIGVESGITSSKDYLTIYKRSFAQVDFLYGHIKLWKKHTDCLLNCILTRLDNINTNDAIIKSYLMHMVKRKIISTVFRHPCKHT